MANNGQWLLMAVIHICLVFGDNGPDDNGKMGQLPPTSYKEKAIEGLLRLAIVLCIV